MSKTVWQIQREIGLKGRAYLAGCLDCDGYFTIKRSTYGIRVRKDMNNPTFEERIGFKQISPEIVNLLYECFGGTRSIQKPSAKNGKPLYSWEVRNLQATICVKTVLPYLRIKRQQAEILLQLRENKEKTKHIRRLGANSNPEDIQLREGLFSQIKSLNDTRTTKPVLI